MFPELMRAAVFEAIDTVNIREIPLPKIKPDYALVRIKAAGLCITDVHVIQGKFQHANPPCILGHEGAGEIVAFGQLTWDTQLKIGDRVVIETMISCGTCIQCIKGFKNLCERGQDIGETRYPGCYSEYVTVPIGNLHKIPEQMTWEEGAIFESFVCPIGGLQRLGINSGDNVLIQGLGPAGLAFIQGAKQLGAGKIIVSDIQDYKLALGKEYGADVVVNPLVDELEEIVTRETDGKGVEVSVEASGAQQAISNSIQFCRDNGSVIYYGIPNDSHNTRFDVTQVIIKQLNLYGTSGAPHSWPTVLKLYDKGVFRLKEMVTHTFPLTEITTAIETITNPDSKAIKIVLIP
jgi:threonine dehydrogenase-like Zn-dependent dehydrogenase